MIVTDLPFKGTDEEIRDQIIDHVIQRLARAHTFGCYTEEDIYQECWVISLIALDSGKYDIRRPLEKFLYKHLLNRLRNLYRDKCFRKMRPNESPDTWEKRSKKKASLMSVAEQTDENPSTFDVVEEVMARDLSDFILARLPLTHQEDYRRLLRDEPLVEIKRQYLRDTITEILTNG